MLKSTLLITTITATSLMAGTSAPVNLASCIGCHGASFEKKALGKSNIVKEMSLKDLEASLIGYKDGSYGGAMKAVMKGQVARYSNEQLKEMAAQIVAK